MVISSEFRLGQYTDDEHREYAPHQIFMTGIFDYQTGRFVNRNGIGSVRICPDDLTRRGAGRGQYYYEVDESASKYFRFLC